MPVDTCHAEYCSLITVWKKIRDCIGGARFVKAAGENYLPLLSEQSVQDYQDYRDRAVFFNATQQTAVGMHGLIYAKKAVLKYPAKLEPIIKDCTMSGVKFEDYCKNTTREQLSVGRAGTLIDYNEIEMRPFISMYCAESILNWRMQRIRGRMRLSLLVLYETSGEYIATNPTGIAKIPDEFDTTEYEQWRVYKLNVDADGSMYVSCEIWRRLTTNGGTGVGKSGPAPSQQFVMINQIFPTRRKQALQQIPFIFHGSQDDSANCDKPLLEDLSDMNVAHYVNAADYENALHVMGCPTPWITGHDDADDDDAMTLGSSRAWTLANPEAKVGFLELEGDLIPLRTAMQDKQEQMALIGARMLIPQKAAVESAETHKLRQTSETASLTNIALVGSASLTDVLKWIYWWMSTESDPSQIEDDLCLVHINEDFIDSSVDPVLFQQMLAALVAAKISYEVWFEFLKKCEIVDPDRTVEEETAAIVTSIQMPQPPAPLVATPPINPPAKKKKPAPAAAA